MLYLYPTILVRLRISFQNYNFRKQTTMFVREKHLWKRELWCRSGSGFPVKAFVVKVGHTWKTDHIMPWQVLINLKQGAYYSTIFGERKTKLFCKIEQNTRHVVKYRQHSLRAFNACPQALKSDEKHILPATAWRKANGGSMGKVWEVRTSLSVLTLTTLRLQFASKESKSPLWTKVWSP